MAHRAADSGPPGAEFPLVNKNLVFTHYLMDKESKIFYIVAARIHFRRLEVVNTAGAGQTW